MALEPLLTTYGYALLYLGTILEGETFVIISAVLCQTGQLKAFWVICTAFLGALSGDVFCFQIGRLGAGKLFERGSHRQRRLDKAAVLLKRNPNLIVFCYRFFYGFRAVIPFLIGATGCSWRRFILLSGAGAALWSITVTAAGIVCGKALLLFTADIKTYQLWGIGALSMVGIGLWAIWAIFQRLRLRRIEGERVGR